MPRASRWAGRRNNRYGLQYCLQCLQQDRKPYFRRTWRLAFITMCLTHKTQLLDRCQFCGAGVSYQIRTLTKNAGLNAASLTVCSACHRDLRHAKHNIQSPDITTAEMQFQRRLILAVEQGWIEVALYEPVYSCLYFIVLRALMLMFASNSSLRTYCTEKYKMFPLSLPSRVRKPEFFDVTTRRALMGMARRLLKDWPHRFVEFCEATEVKRFQLETHMPFVPFWFWTVMDQHLEDRRYYITKQELESAVKYLDKPRGNCEDSTNSDRVQAAMSFLNVARKDNRLLDHLQLSGTRADRTWVFRDIPKPSINPISMPDALWQTVEHLLPKRPKADRRVMDAINYRFAAECRWFELPPQFGHWRTVYSKYRVWRQSDAFSEIMALCSRVYPNKQSNRSEPENLQSSRGK